MFNIHLSAKAFLSGVATVLIGAAVAAALAKLELVSPLILLGMFTGAMTSTPSFSLACELTGESALLSAGYAMAYLPGLLFTLLFVQALSRREGLSGESLSEHKTADIIPVIAVGAAGTLLGKFTSVGAAVCTLAIGMIWGALQARAGKPQTEAASVKEFGLMLFFIGVGIPSGACISENFKLSYIVITLAIPTATVLLAYLTIRFVFKFSRGNAVSVLCGGMTSTPAISLLQERQKTDMTLYSAAYGGALIASMLAVRLLIIYLK